MANAPSITIMKVPISAPQRPFSPSSMGASPDLYQTNGFLRWRVPAGRHRVATWRYHPVQVPGVPHRLGSGELHCRAGDTKFLRNAMPHSIFAEMTVTLSQVDAETGRKAIHARTLIVDRLWQNPSGRGQG